MIKYLITPESHIAIKKRFCMTTKNFVLIISFFPSGLSVCALLAFIIPYLPALFSFLIQQKYQLQIYIHLLGSGSQTAYKCSFLKTKGTKVDTCGS